MTWGDVFSKSRSVSFAESTNFTGRLPPGLSAFLQKRVPVFAWASSYERGHLASDIIAGIVVTMVLVPTAMAYAQLAGLPAQYGLYGSILPCIVYALFSRSPVLSVAPVTVVSLMVGSVLAPLAEPGSADAVGYALILAALSGVFFLLLGALRLGAVANFVSNPVLYGFVAAAGIVMVCSQVKTLLGLSFPVTSFAPYVLLQSSLHLGDVRIWTWVLAGGSVGLLVYRAQVTAALAARGLLGPRIAANLPKAMPLVVVGLGILLSAALQLDAVGVRIVGAIPSGLPPLSAPAMDFAAWRALLPGAVLISVVGFIESMAVAKVLARKRGETVDFNQELLAMGAANLSAGFSSGYPVSAGLFRSAINVEAGAMTPLASIITAVCVLLTLVFLGPVLSYLPQTVLAAIVITSCMSLIKFKPFWQAWERDRTEGGLFLATFAAVLMFGIEVGLIAGIGLAVAHHLWASSRPKVEIIASEGLAHQGSAHQGSAHLGSAVAQTGVNGSLSLTIKIGDSLYFGNARHVEDQVLGLLATRPAAKNCVLDLSSVNSLDSTAAEMLESLEVELQRLGITLQRHCRQLRP